LQEKYEKETEEKQKVEEEKTEKALYEAATANYNKLTNQTGYDAFIKSPEGKAALTAAGQAASQAGANGSTEYI
jgi:chromosomal replication initiation ATPase DnaA